MEEKNTRRQVAVTLIITTLVFFALLAGALLLHRQLPVIRENRLIAALESGNLSRARSLAVRLGNEEKERAYLVECDYLEALSLMESAHWEEAARLLTAAAGYQDAAERKTECDYQLAIQMTDEERWDEAEAQFLALSGYRDALDRYNDCRFRHAEALEAEGRSSEAAVLYSQLGDYGEARTRLYAMATAVTGIEDPEAAVAALQGRTPVALAHMAELSEKREALPRGIIGVGFYHTVGLGADGGVLACGDNSFGQCEVSSFHDAVSVAAGAYHTLVLHKDGTVSAVGRDSEGQCGVDSWRDVVQIAAGDYASFGLCADGTIFCTGYNNYEKTAGWRDLVAISAGSYNVAALRQDGGAWVYPALDGGDALTELVDLTVNTGYGVGVLADGSLVGNAFVPENWSDILVVSGSSTLLLGLRADGSVLCHAFRVRDALDLSSVTDAVAIAAGGTHSAIVLRDGRVQIFGDVSRGQGDTAGWILAVPEN